jgi:hypothetical protein
MKVAHLSFSLLVSMTMTSISYNSLAFVHVGCYRRRLSVDAIKSPLDQLKLDFLGSLENAYDFNDANPASTLFLSRLVEQVGTSIRRCIFYTLQFFSHSHHLDMSFQQVSPEAISRNIIESFGDLGAGKWRVVYVQECSTSFGFGSFFGSVTSADVELGNDGSIACK